MSRAYTFHSMLRCSAPVIVLGLALSAQADPQTPPTLTVLCPLPYLDMMGERMDCSYGMTDQTVTTREGHLQLYVSKVEMCEETLARWENAWDVCAAKVRQKDKWLDEGVKWAVYPPAPPAHGCRYTAGAKGSWDLMFGIWSHCRDVMDWWKAKYRNSIRSGYLYELSAHDEQRMRSLVEEYTRPLD